MTKRQLRILLTILAFPAFMAFNYYKPVWVAGLRNYKEGKVDSLAKIKDSVAISR